MQKILFIDDEPSILEYFKRTQADSGCELLTAQNGEDGCQLALDPDVKLIITDFVLPGGLQRMDLIHKLKKLRPDLPIVVISGFPDTSIMEECRKAGVTDFLTKPFELSFIPRMIERLIQNTPGMAP